MDDSIRQAAQTIYQALIEAELTALIGATPYERTPDRLAQHNGHRGRVLSTTAGDLELRIPKLRAGSFLPSLLERRRRVDHALFCDQQRKEDQQLHVQPLRWLRGAMSRAANAPHLVALVRVGARFTLM